jgi:dTDP-glucose pyrophosphorylase
METQDQRISEKNSEWRRAVLPEASSIGQVVLNLNEVPIKIVLVVNEASKLLGTISDGDIRRGLLRGLNLDSPASKIIQYNAFVVPPEMSREMVQQLMVANKIYQIPIVDSQTNLVGLHLWDDITACPKRVNTMIIMAGGKGRRLLPHTQDCPKPMVLVRGKPMLEHIIERAKAEGFNRFVLAIYHLGQIIESYFGDGAWLDVNIDYLHENSPLGTAGALGLLNPIPDEPFVVTNGDVITDVRYGELIDFHNRHESSATMAVRRHEWKNPFGVVHMQGVEIIGFEEKPITQSYINAGVYVLSPDVITELAVDTACDMPTLFELLHSKAKRTIAYPLHEAWLDVGRPDDLLEANKIPNNGI